MASAFFESVLTLITRTSTDLPPDVRAAMKVAMTTEAPGTQSAQALSIIAQNIDQAADCEGAICQDTGMPTFEVKTPVGANQIVMKQQIREAVAEATRRGNCVPIRSIRSPARTRAAISGQARPLCTSNSGNGTTSK
jgi:fumarate hydratase, class I